MEIIMDILSNEATWLVLGIIIKSVAPAWIPVLGVGKKLAEELTELHNKSREPNANIKVEAEKSGLKVAEKWLAKKLS